MLVRFSYGLPSLCAFAAWQTITLPQQHYAIANTHLCLREALSYSHVACGPKRIQILVHFTCRQWQVEVVNRAVFSFLTLCKVSIKIC